ncbi:hypothetical protein [Brevibacillus brevis]|uniref:hypothetical protein n=1 Tax=Brevibacillus brevis TaxID=1393 RepID=UPI000AB7D880|nr:hypothetical protein [Brevibacillus brevis]
MPTNCPHRHALRLLADDYKRLYLLTGLPIRDAPHRLNCSETVDRMFAAAGINLTPDELGKVTPGDLVKSNHLLKIA